MTLFYKIDNFSGARCRVDSSRRLVFIANFFFLFLLLPQVFVANSSLLRFLPPLRLFHNISHFLGACCKLQTNLCLRPTVCEIFQMNSSIFFFLLRLRVFLFFISLILRLIYIFFFLLLLLYPLFFVLFLLLTWAEGLG